MQNLYWKFNGETRTLVENAYTSEQELEKYIFTNQDLLGDISIIYRQIKTGNKQGIPDMLGVDKDNRICIIELKNQIADEDILPQALGYAIWAETNPDSIKAIWLESKNKPDDITIDWDNIDIRVILVAPGFKTTVPRMAGKIGYPIDLVQIKRYSYDNNEFISVEFLDKPIPQKVTTTKVTIDWNWEYYESEHGVEATSQFRKVVDEIEGFVKKQKWSVPYNINKYYTGFKIANKVIFNVAWNGTYAWSVRFKIPKELAVGFKGDVWEFISFSDTFKEAYFRPKNSNSTNIHELEPFFIEAYKRISGDR
jgi:hypothetical protein